MLSEQVIYHFVSLLSVCYLSWHPYLSISMLLNCLYSLYLCALIFFHISDLRCGCIGIKTVLLKGDSVDIQELRSCRWLCQWHVNVYGLTCLKDPCSLMQAVFRAWPWESLALEFWAVISWMDKSVTAFKLCISSWWDNNSRWTWLEKICHLEFGLGSISCLVPSFCTWCWPSWGE